MIKDINNACDYVIFFISQEKNKVFENIIYTLKTRPILDTIDAKIHFLENHGYSENNSQSKDIRLVILDYTREILGIPYKNLFLS